MNAVDAPDGFRWDMDGDVSAEPVNVVATTTTTRTTATATTTAANMDLKPTEMSRSADDAAFEDVFRRYYATVYGILLRLTGSADEAEDLTQEAFIRLHDRQIVGDAKDNLGGWLYRVATNLGFNALRSQRRRQHRLLRWARLERPLRSDAPSAAAEAEHRSDAPSAAAEAEHRADAEAVRRALAELPERDRTALILRHSGVPYVEIAQTIGVKPGSVGTILVRAERALRERYAALHQADPKREEHDVDRER